MSSEPKYLIVGPDAPGGVPASQPAEPAKSSGSIIHAFNHDPKLASSVGACNRWGWRGPDDTVDCPACLDILTRSEDARKLLDHDKPSKVKVEGTYKGKTADQWREMAKQSNRRADESWESSDTDGALSQFASGFIVREYRLCADLAEHDGVWEFRALFTLTGALVPDATYVRTSQGRWVWRIGRGPDAQWFNESQAKSGYRRRQNDAAKGFYVGTVRRPAYVATHTSGRGTGGLMGGGHYIAEKPNSPVEIVDSGVGHMNLATEYQDRS